MKTLDVVCPRCGAEPGQSCHTPSGAPAKAPHATREMAASVQETMEGEPMAYTHDTPKKVKGRKKGRKAIIKEARTVIELQNDDQYTGGQDLAQMVLEYFGEES